MSDTGSGEDESRNLSSPSENANGKPERGAWRTEKATVRIIHRANTTDKDNKLSSAGYICK